MSEDMDVSQIADVVGEAKAEKMLPASHVEAIVKREKAAVAEKLNRDFEARMQQQQAQSMGGMQEPNLADLEAKIMARLQEQQQAQQEQVMQQQRQQAAEQVAAQYYLKVGKGKEKFPDFDEIMGDFKPEEFPGVTFLAAEQDNTDEIMHELMKNPAKLIQMHTAATTSETVARKLMKDLADSIRENNKALETHKSAPSPLNRHSPSPGAGATTTERSFKGASWLKG
jgi:hypothetical protein